MEVSKNSFEKTPVRIAENTGCDLQCQKTSKFFEFELNKTEQTYKTPYE